MDDRYTDAARYIAGSHCCHSLWQKEYTWIHPSSILPALSNQQFDPWGYTPIQSIQKSTGQSDGCICWISLQSMQRGINQKHNCICILPFYIQTIPYRQPFAYRIKCCRKREHGNSFINASFTNTKKPRLTRYRHPPVSVTQGKADAAIKNACKHMFS